MRRAWVGLAVVALLLPSSLLFWQARDAPHLGLFQDDSLYVAAAKSLAGGHGYRITSLPEQPYQTKYPPLFPALLSVIWRLDSSFPANLPWVMLLQWLIWLFYLAAVALVIRTMPELQRPTKLAVVAFVAVAPAFVFLSLNIMAEALLAALVLLTFWLLGLDCRPSPSRAFLAGLCAAAAYLTKTAALPLLAAAPLALLWRRRFRAAALFSIAPLIAAVAWAAWTSAHRLRTEDVNLLYYTDYIGFYLKTVSPGELPLMFSVNLSALVENTGRLIVFSPPAGSAVKILHIVVGVFVLLSTVALLVELRTPALALFAGLYTAQNLVWNYSPNERFLFPLLFLLVAGFFHGMWKLLTRLVPTRLATAVWIGSVAALAGWSLAHTWSDVSDQLPRQRRYQQRLVCTARWVEVNIAQDENWLAYRDVDLYLWSGRRGMRLVRLPQPYYRLDSTGAEGVLRNMPDYARRAEFSYLLWDPDDFSGDLFLGDARRLEEILGELKGVVLEHEACGARIYRFTP